MPVNRAARRFIPPFLSSCIGSDLNVTGIRRRTAQPGSSLGRVGYRTLAISLKKCDLSRDIEFGTRIVLLLSSKGLALV